MSTTATPRRSSRVPRRLTGCVYCGRGKKDVCPEHVDCVEGDPYYSPTMQSAAWVARGASLNDRRSSH